ncbi:hypothetical protein [Larkinella soli]|uniref:hypothetical protein n=1 Tax=Larkinella soli TaxID=1770527 RepID=UPI000FFC1F7F|nr:hypothetical protein [Larkinella soli]
MTVHYDGKDTHITYTDTIEDARAYLAALITTKQVDKEDTLSIVRIPDDYMVYYRRRNNTVDSVLGRNRWVLLAEAVRAGASQNIFTNLYKKFATRRGLA